MPPVFETVLSKVLTGLSPRKLEESVKSPKADGFQE
jgi:hypothetical protein